MKFWVVIFLLVLGCNNNQFPAVNNSPLMPTPTPSPSPSPSPSPTPDPTEVYYTFYIHYNSLCLEIDGSNSLIQNDCSSSSDQMFEIVENGTIFQIKKPNSTTECLTYIPGQAEISTALCDSSLEDQQWTKTLTSSGDYQIRNVASDECWNVPNGYTTPNLPLILYSCGSSGNENQNEIFNIIEQP